MPKCQVCQLLDVAVSVSDGACMHHLCRPCYYKLDRRFFDPTTMKIPEQYERMSAARRELEIEQLKQMWALPCEVGR